MDVTNSLIYGVSLHPSPAFSLPCIHTTRMKFHIPSPVSQNASFPDLRLALQKKWRDSSRFWLGWLSLTDPERDLECFEHISEKLRHLSLEKRMSGDSNSSVHPPCHQWMRGQRPSPCFLQTAKSLRPSLLWNILIPPGASFSLWVTSLTSETVSHSKRQERKERQR